MPPSGWAMLTGTEFLWLVPDLVDSGVDDTNDDDDNTNNYDYDSSDDDDNTNDYDYEDNVVMFDDNANKAIKKTNIAQMDVESIF